MQILQAGRKIVKAVLLLLQVPVLPPLLAIFATSPAQTSQGIIFWAHSGEDTLLWSVTCLQMTSRMEGC